MLLWITNLSGQNKVHEKTFVLPKSFSEVAMCLPKVTATASINNFINAMKITTE